MVFKAALQRLKSGWQIYPASLQVKKSHPLEWNRCLSGESLRNHDTIACVYSYQTTVKGAIVERAKTEAVSGVSAELNRRIPWNDVAGIEERDDVQLVPKVRGLDD